MEGPIVADYLSIITAAKENTMADHQALWLPATRANLVVGPASEVDPRAGEIVVRARAVAVNPFDRYIQAMGDVIAGYLAYPAVLGTDVAGEVVAVGAGVTRFRVGDRVVGHAAGLEKSRNRAAEGAFQERVVLLADMAAPIPDALSLEEAAVLPLGLSTAACGLFQQDFLGLRAPKVRPEPTGEVVLIWGGSTSVGSNAIQLARAAGYDVVTTCSPRNFGYVRRLGALAAFDYNSPSVGPDIAAALQGRRVAGALSIGKGAAAACMDILARGEGRRFVAQVTPPTSFDDVLPGKERWRALLPAITRMVAGNLSLTLRARRRGVGTKMVWGGSLIANEVGPMIYEAFLPQALAEGAYEAVPQPEIVGHGLHHVPAAMERQRRGVSARKLVVTL
jgi:NADPH:quinone reductase-like Zn-dependent oxidoreductase